MAKINITNDLIRVCPFVEDEPWIEVDDETLEKIMRGQFKVKDGELIDISKEIENHNKITELKKKLADTDYQAIKYAEGQISEQDYASIKAQRQAWRDEINELEG